MGDINILTIEWKQNVKKITPPRCIFIGWGLAKTKVNIYLCKSCFSNPLRDMAPIGRACLSPTLRRISCQAERERTRAKMR